MYGQILPNEDPSLIIEHLFRIFDRDNDGTIDFKEFVLATEITSSGDPEEKLRWTFKVSTYVPAYTTLFFFRSKYAMKQYFFSSILKTFWLT